MVPAIAQINAPAVTPAEFQGRLLISASDTDMMPSAYRNGALGPAAGRDALSVIRLDRPAASRRAVELPVGNAVTGPPALLAVTPNGRHAIVIETQESRRTRSAA